MNTLLPAVALALGSLTLAACQESAEAPADAAETTAAEPSVPAVAVAGYDGFGTAPADTAAALAAATVTAAPGTYAGKPVLVSGTVSEVCQMAGCWATLQTDAGTIRITMPKDASGAYAFTLPKDISGRRVIAAGTLEQTTLTADHAAHMAEESGKAGADTARFEDAPELQLKATGVLVAKL